MMWYFYIIAFLRTISFSVQTRIKINDISLNFNFHGFLDTTAWGHRLIIDFGTKRNMVQFRQKLGDAVWLTSVTPSIAFSHKFLENSWYSKFAFWPPNFFPKNDWKPIWIIGSSENHRNFVILSQTVKSPPRQIFGALTSRSTRLRRVDSPVKIKRGGDASRSISMTKVTTLFHIWSSSR